MYVLTENNSVKTYPYTLRMLRADNPQISFPSHITDETLEDFGVYRVTFDEGADINTLTHNNVGADLPILRDGAWVIESSVVAKTQDEIDECNQEQEIFVRNHRDDLLKATDWYGLSDVTMPAEMATYRQALRDITTHANFPNLTETDWPTKPE